MENTVKYEKLTDALPSSSSSRRKYGSKSPSRREMRNHARALISLEKGRNLQNIDPIIQSAGAVTGL
jgi:hypothetical protein